MRRGHEGLFDIEFIFSLHFLEYWLGIYTVRMIEYIYMNTNGIFTGKKKDPQRAMTERSRRFEKISF